MIQTLFLIVMIERLYERFKEVVSESTFRDWEGEYHDIVQKQFSPEERGENVPVSPNIEGLQISVNAHVEAIQFLLKEGFQYVLTERSCKCVGGLFWSPESKRRKIRQTPLLREFGYNDLTIAAQRDIAPVLGQCWRSV